MVRLHDLGRFLDEKLLKSIARTLCEVECIVRCSSIGALLELWWVRWSRRMISDSRWFVVTWWKLLVKNSFLRRKSRSCTVIEARGRENLPRPSNGERINFSKICFSKRRCTVTHRYRSRSSRLQRYCRSTRGITRDYSRANQLVLEDERKNSRGDAIPGVTTKKQGSVSIPVIWQQHHTASNTIDLFNHKNNSPKTFIPRGPMKRRHVGSKFEGFDFQRDTTEWRTSQNRVHQVFRTITIKNWKLQRQRPFRSCDGFVL